MTHIIALDQGTSSSRTIIFTAAGQIVCSAQKEFTQHYPKPGWVEHDAEEIWNTQLTILQDAVKKSGLKPGDFAAIGITNQRETLAVWDRKTGKPLHRAIVWQDRRTADMIAGMRTPALEKSVREKTGLPLDPYFTGTKIKWILENNPDIKSKAAKGEVCFGTIDAWLLFRLTGGKSFATDASNASRTLLMNIHKGGWDKELTDWIGVSADSLPEIHANDHAFGETDAAGFRLPVCGMAGDQQSALFGQLCFEPGDVKNTYGTGCFILAFTGNKAVPSKNNLLTTVAWKLNGKPTEYALEGSVFVAGAAIQWLRDGLGLISSAPEVNPLAEKVQDTDGVYFVPAFTGLGAPYWNPNARGAIVGLTRGTTSAHIARAALESLALQSAEVFDAMSADLGKPIRSIKVDGGACMSDLLMKMQADFTGCEVVRPKTIETTALGAALLAALGKGIYKDRQEMAKAIEHEKTFRPTLSEEARTKKRKAWKKAVATTIHHAQP